MYRIGLYSLIGTHTEQALLQMPFGRTAVMLKVYSIPGLRSERTAVVVLEAHFCSLGLSPSQL